MDYLLDTNICIHYFKGQFEIKEKIEQIGYDKFAISDITLAELIYGAEKSQKRDKNIEVIYNFSEKIIIIPIPVNKYICQRESKIKKIGNNNQ